MNDRFMAMLALTQPDTVDAASVIAEIQRAFPDYGAVLEPLSDSGPDRPLLIKAGGATITVMFVDKPVPDGTLDQAIETDRIWPEAKTRLAAHRAHIIVSHLEETNTQAEALLHAATLQVFAAAVSSLTSTIGVYWSSGDTVTEVGVFRDTTKALVAGTLPIAVWVQMRWLDGPPTETGARTLAVVTTGLLPFLGREIEFHPTTWPPHLLAEHLISLMQYLLQNGLVIQDRETFGFDENTKIGVLYHDQGQRPGVPVLALVALA